MYIIIILMSYVFMAGLTGVWLGWLASQDSPDSDDFIFGLGILGGILWFISLPLSLGILLGIKFVNFLGKKYVSNRSS